MLATSLLLGVSSLLSVASAIDPLTIRGNKFFNSDGSQFFIKGIAYQRSPLDPLIATTQCELDAKLMATLGANAIRVYHVDPAGDHDGCMKAFGDEGIHMFIDLDTFHTQIEQDGPPHWNSSQLTAFTEVLDAFAGYNNAAGFFVGNEIITTSNGSWAAPFIKAAVRDVKAHVASKNYDRSIYIGYSAADISELRPNLQNYLVCGDEASANIDFFGLNAYEWCGKSDFMTSGYDQLTINATNYPVPIFFSETGCNTPKPRLFDDQAAIFGPKMDQIWAGSIIYEWIQEANDYGLISYGDAVDAKTAVGGDTVRREGTPTPVSPDFENLKTAWAKVSPTGPVLSAYTTTFPTPSCPALTTGIWNVNAVLSLPTLGATAMEITSAATTGGSTTATSSVRAASATTSSKSSAGERTRVNLVAAMAGFIGAIALLA